MVFFGAIVLYPELGEAKGLGECYVLSGIFVDG